MGGVVSRRGCGDEVEFDACFLNEKEILETGDTSDSNSSESNSIASIRCKALLEQSKIQVLERSLAGADPFTYSRIFRLDLLCVCIRSKGSILAVS